jgi:uncharacterized membrane protein
LHFWPEFSIVINAVHLLAKEFWVGGLIVFTFVLMPVLNRLGRASMVAFTLTLQSKYFSAALAVTGATGAYIVWLHLKDPAYVFTTEWGTRFAVLALFGGIFAAIRIYNQLVVDSSVAADSIAAQHGLRKDAASSWQYSLPSEMFIGIAVLFVTSQLIITTPPYPPERAGLQKKASSQGAAITLSVHPIEGTQFLIEVTDEKTGAPATVTEAVVTLLNADKNIGPLVADTEKRFEGGFALPQDSLSIPGEWSIDITARRPDAYDAVTSFRLDYPTELNASRTSGDQRRFGAFEGLSAGIALLSLFISLALYRFSAGLHARAAETDTRRGLSNAGYRTGKALAGGLLIALLFTSAVFVSYESLIKTDFQRLCETNKGEWMQSVPRRDGAVLSPNTLTGCTTDAGMHHFTDVREYSYFLDNPLEPEHRHH